MSRIQFSRSEDSVSAQTDTLQTVAAQADIECLPYELSYAAKPMPTAA